MLLWPLARALSENIDAVRDIFWLASCVIWFILTLFDNSSIWSLPIRFLIFLADEIQKIFHSSYFSSFLTVSHQDNKEIKQKITGRKKHKK